MANPRDYYEVLGMKRDATAEQIRKAYRQLARKHHPDVSKAPDAAKKFGEIQEAYDVLSDAEKRKAYDRFGHAGVGNAARGSPGGEAGSPGGFRTGPGTHTWSTSGFPGGGVGVETEDLESIFEEMFGGRGRSPFGGAAGPGRHGGPGGHGGGRQAHADKGQDIEYTVTVTFMTAALGGTEQLRLAPTAGSSAAGETISVKIPAGIEVGAKLRVKGKGQPGLRGAPGDLILTIEVGKHPYFRREGLDLFVDVPITIAEAVLGATVTMPLLSGTAQIKAPPGVSSGRKLRVRGKGIVDAKGKAGDYYAVVQIVAPTLETLSEQSQEAVKQLANELKNPRDSASWADNVKD